jgi:hypothetical protein
MRHEKMDPAKSSTCTTCQAADDFSNYWTAPIFFKARNGTYKRVPQKSNTGFEGQNGGMTVYYMQNQLADFQQKAKVIAFQPVESATKDATLRTLTELGVSHDCWILDRRQPRRSRQVPTIDIHLSTRHGDSLPGDQKFS